MKSNSKIYAVILFLFMITVTCRKPYLPSAITAPNSYLVADGFININGITTFVLSRTRNLVDTITNIPELNANISIQSQSSGQLYPLTDIMNTGTYSSDSLSLSASDEYRLQINTADGDQFLSAYVPVKIAAPIDSITWKQNADYSVTTFLNTHDPSNNTRYYKWDFIETWEHDARVLNYYGESNGVIFILDSSTQMNKCWTNAPSTNIITGTSVTLSQDVISEQPLETIPRDDTRIKVRYSILVKQLPLTEDAFNYWNIIQKNSQQLGTLFDLQPSQLNGNIQSTLHPDEPVIGFITAATESQQRIFITNDQLLNWDPSVTGRDCDMITIPTNPADGYAYNYPDTAYAPYYFTGDDPAYLIVTRKECIDCREQGGSTIKPSYW